MASVKPSYPAYHPAAYDVEKGAVLNDFAEKHVRLGFIRKVFGLLSVQLALTTAIAGFIIFNESCKSFLQSNPWMLPSSMVASFALILALGAFKDKHPTNLVLLFAFTAVEGILVGAVSSQYSTTTVVSAFAITAGVTLALCMYALRTKSDFTTMGGFLFSMLMSVMLASFLGMFFKMAMLHTALSFAGAALFSLYIIYDVQMLVGGHHENKVSPDDYVLGAISIYLDIINLFLYILRILSSSQNSQ